MNPRRILYITIILALTLSLATTISNLAAQGSYNVYAFVTTDAPIYIPGNQITVQAYVFPSAHESVPATIKFYFTDLPNPPQMSEKTVTIPSVDDQAMYIVESDPATLPEVSDGFYHVKMEVWIGGQLAAQDTVEFKVVHGPPTPDEPMILFVWHNHQAPNYLPDGRFLSYWHIGHFFNDGLGAYYKMIDYGYPDMGTYYLHYYLLKKYPNVKANEHYSPSLLYQLYLAQAKGFRLYDPTIGRPRTFGPDSTLAQAIRDFFEGLGQLHKENKAYVMTSVFAHTIQGYIIERYKVSYMLRYDLELGKEWTARLVTDTDAMWTPEMAWSDLLREIYADEGIKYTVLDGTHHFPSAKGDKGTIYEPYIIKDLRGRKIIVLFRDQEISDGYIGFTNNDWGNPRQADRDARALYYKIYDKLAFTNYYRPIVTIAADGENWILFAPSAANGALFLDRIYAYMDKLTTQGIMMSGTFKDAVQYHPPSRVLDTITWTSWLGGWYKWTTQGGEQHAEAWSLLDHAMGKYLALKYYLGIDSYDRFMNMINTDEKFNESVIDLIHAIDSDYWWWEFFSMYFISEWLDEFDNDVSNLLNYSVEVSITPKPPIIGSVNKISVKITNNNNYAMPATYIKIIAVGLNQTQQQISLDPGETETIYLPVEITERKDIVIRVQMWNPGTIIDSLFTGEHTYLFHDEEYTIAIGGEAPSITAVDLAVSVSITDIYGNYADIAPTAPGDHTFTIIISTANGQPTPEELPIRLLIYINGKTAIDEEVKMPKGVNRITVEKAFNFDVGTYTYKVEVQYEGDPDTSNNVVSGTINVKESAIPSPGGGGISSDYLIGGLVIVIALIILVYALFFYGRKK